MSNIKQSDVKNHLSPQFRTKIHLCQPESPPAANGHSVAEPDAIEASPSSFTEDFVREHSVSADALVQGNLVICSVAPQAPTASKSVQP
jgi:hypothetical protein